MRRFANTEQTVTTGTVLTEFTTMTVTASPLSASETLLNRRDPSETLYHDVADLQRRATSTTLSPAQKTWASIASKLGSTVAQICTCIEKPKTVTVRASRSADAQIYSSSRFALTLYRRQIIGSKKLTTTVSRTTVTQTTTMVQTVVALSTSSPTYTPTTTFIFTAPVSITVSPQVSHGLLHSPIVLTEVTDIHRHSNRHPLSHPSKQHRR